MAGSRRPEKQLAWAASMDLVQNRRKLEMTKVRLSNEGKQDKQDLERFRIYEFDMCIVKIPMLKSQN